MQAVIMRGRMVKSMVVIVGREGKFLDSRAAAIIAEERRLLPSKKWPKYATHTAKK